VGRPERVLVNDEKLEGTSSEVTQKYGWDAGQPMTGLQGQIALVTGGARGIGRSVSVKLAQHGAQVYVNYRWSERAAEECVKEIAAQGGTAHIIQGDVSKVEDVLRIVESVLTESGRLDILVNNAGITRDKLLTEVRNEDWDELVNNNLSSVFYCSRAVVRSMMRKRYGRIINLSSVAARNGGTGQAVYAATKAGIEGFTHALGTELASRNITVNAVAPGVVGTDMIAAAHSVLKERVLPLIPLKRYGTPDEIADVICFLASPSAAYITGQVIPVNGGLA
jgi:3-oxoacyl-[acyl-carrier protein] reductase